MIAKETAESQTASSLSGVAVKAWNEHFLLSALVELTYRCNLDCSFCYNDTSLQGTPLTNEQYVELLEDLADLQVLSLTLSGGEPLAHPHFFELGARARDLGFVVRVKSNGHALRGELARRLKDEVDPYIVEVSLHGATAEVHDRQTRVAGSFERLMANLDEMTALGLRLQINSALTSWNEHQIEEILAISEQRQIKLVIDPEITPRDNGDKGPLAILPSQDAIKRLYGLLHDRAARGAASGAPIAIGSEADTGLVPVVSDKHCGAGSATIAIDPYGAVYPCVQWRWPVGNLHEQSIRQIWNGSPILEDVREANRQVKAMVDGFGERGSRLGFCPGAARLNTGSATELYQSPLDKLGAADSARREKARERLPVVG